MSRAVTLAPLKAIASELSPQPQPASRTSAPGGRFASISAVVTARLCFERNRVSVELYGLTAAACVATSITVISPFSWSNLRPEISS